LSQKQPIDASIARAGTIREAEGPENEKALTKLACDGYASVAAVQPLPAGSRVLTIES